MGILRILIDECSIRDVENDVPAQCPRMIYAAPNRGRNSDARIVKAAMNIAPPKQYATCNAKTSSCKSESLEAEHRFARRAFALTLAVGHE